MSTLLPILGIMITMKLFVKRDIFDRAAAFVRSGCYFVCGKRILQCNCAPVAEVIEREKIK